MDNPDSGRYERVQRLQPMITGLSLNTSNVVVTIVPSALNTVLTGPQGPAAADLARRAIRVESQAKLNASGRPGPMVRTGRLRSSITWVLVLERGEIYALIGSNVKYARYVEMGTDRAPPYPYLRPALAAAQ